MSDNLRTQLTRIKERADAATPGPWVVHAPYGDWEAEVVTAEEPATATTRAAAAERIAHADSCGDVWFDFKDAVFIAHARTDLPRLTAALESVLALHRPTFAAGKWVGDMGHHECAHCHAVLSDETPNCPTVRAITEAMQEDA